jgi:hypothetical protein
MQVTVHASNEAEINSSFIFNLYCIYFSDAGGLEVRFMKLAGRNKVQHITIKSVDIEFQSFNANLYTGKVLVNPSKNTVAENLATYWSICVLYVLCSPKSSRRQLLLTQSGNLYCYVVMMYMYIIETFTLQKCLDHNFSP